MKIDLIKQVADELDIPWQELLEAKTDKIGIITEEDFSSTYRFHTLSDVISALFTMTEIQDISFQLSCTKPPENPEWTSALMVDGKGTGTYNTDFCLFMENWMTKLAALQSGNLSKEHYDTWKREMLDYYSDSYFSDFSSQMAKNKKARGKKKKPLLTRVEIISTKEDYDGE